MIRYEQPLNERVRMFLRVEQLFQRIDFHLARDDSWDIQSNIARLLELVDLASRSDLKREAIKELERQAAAMSSMIDRVEPEQRDPLQASIEHKRFLIGHLHEQQGQVGLHLKSNAFLTSLRQRSTVGGGSVFSHDLALYHHWLSRPVADCTEVINDWLKPLAHYRESVENSLATIRDHASHQSHQAINGFFQCSLDNSKAVQLVYIELEEGGEVFPEISAGKLRVSTRFMRFNDVNEKPVQSNDTINFSLGVCHIC